MTCETSSGVGSVDAMLSFSVLQNPTWGYIQLSRWKEDDGGRFDIRSAVRKRDREVVCNVESEKLYS